MSKTYAKYLLMAGGLLLWLVLGSTTAQAMDRWAALSWMESRNNDAAVGRGGEISRFQIQPALWKKYCRSHSLSGHTNPRVALQVAQAIMADRSRDFERRYHRHPTTFQYYILWVSPSQMARPGRVVSRRAVRFCHLVGS